jgi:RimJ/RimL family protein N-acetyltransferase
MNLEQKDLFQGKLVKLSVSRDTDAEEMAVWQEDSDYLRKVDTDIAYPKSPLLIKEQDLSRGLRTNSFEFRLRTIENDCLIGFVALHSIEWNNQSSLLAIGIGDTNYRRKGFGSEALRLILRYAFHELNLNRIGLDVISYNTPAIEAYKKVGFKVEGQMRNAVLRDGKPFDRMIMGILHDEWEDMQG